MTDAEAHAMGTAEREQFEAHGYVVLRGFLDAEALGPLREAYDALVAETEAADGGAKTGQLIQRGGPSSSDDAWRTAPHLTAVVEAGRALLGPDIEFWYDQIIMKPAGNPHSTPWHQDAGYWRTQKNGADERALTAWLALSEVTPARSV